MLWMRVAFLLVLVPLVAGSVARADVSAPRPSGAASAPPAMMEYSKSESDGKITATPANVLDAPYRFVIAGRTVTVGFEKDFKIHVRVAGGGEVALDAAGQGYMSRVGGNVSASSSRRRRSRSSRSRRVPRRAATTGRSTSASSTACRATRSSSTGSPIRRRCRRRR